MLKSILILSLWVMIPANMVLAQSKETLDPTSIKLDQMENGFASLLSRIIELENNLSSAKGVEDLKLEISNLNEAISTLLTDFGKSKLESSEKLDSLVLEVSDLVELQRDANYQIDDLKSRLSVVEAVLMPLAGEKRIVKDASTSKAKIFKVSSLGSLVDALPLAENCSEIGKILQSYYDRSYNTAFVKTNTGDVGLCKFELGRWQVISGDQFEPGHVITAE